MQFIPRFRLVVLSGTVSNRGILFIMQKAMFNPGLSRNWHLNSVCKLLLSYPKAPSIILNKVKVNSTDQLLVIINNFCLKIEK